VSVPFSSVLRSRLQDLRSAALPIAQATLAAGAAWLVARHVLGHPQPYFAPIAAVISVGASHLARGRRTIELGEHVPPELVDALHDLAAAARALEPALDGSEREDVRAAAREAALGAAARATLALERTGNLAVSVLVGQVRATATDLLRALGLAPREARDMVREAADRERRREPQDAPAPVDQ